MHNRTATNHTGEMMNIQDQFPVFQAVTPVHKSSTDSMGIQRQSYGTLCLNNLSDKNTYLSSTTCRNCTNECHIDENNRQSIVYPDDIANNLHETNTCQQHLIRFEEDCRNNSLNNAKYKVPMNLKDPHHSSEMIEGGNETGPNFRRVKNRIKRKVENTTSDDDYIPSKRISPYLNTQKERIDTRVKILKMSIEKLRDLDDPEVFLRRTVLVNNTMKRMQGDLQMEEVKRKYMRGLKRNGVPTIKCSLELYLFDDPLVSGNNEKISDDTTDKFIFNVFEKKSEERTR